MAICLTGSLLHYAFRKYPSFYDFVNLIESDRAYPKVDINHADAQELVSVPYIGAYTADNIIHYRQEHGPFTSLAQLKNVKGVRDKNFERFVPYLKISP